jgi:hypothetical protein
MPKYIVTHVVTPDCAEYICIGEIDAGGKIRLLLYMTPKQYKAIIDQLGLSQERAGEWLGVSARTGQNYAAKGPPEPVAKLLRLMVKLNLKPEDVR